MSEQQEPTSEHQPPPEGVSESDWLAFNREALASSERLQTMQLEVQKVRAQADDQQRRMVALNCSLASYGLGHQALNPSVGKIDGDAITKRADQFDRFIRGEPAGEVVEFPRPVPPAAPE